MEVLLTMYFKYEYKSFENVLLGESWIFEGCISGTVSFYFSLHNIYDDDLMVQYVKKKIDMDIEDLNSQFYTDLVHFKRVRRKDGIYVFKVGFSCDVETDKISITYS